MPIDNIKDAITKAGIIKTVLYVLFGSIGGIVMYLNQIRRGEKFRKGMFVINIIIAGYVGWLIGTILPEYLIKYQMPIVSISGFLSHPILGLIEKRLPDLIVNKVLGKEK